MTAIQNKQINFCFINFIMVVHKINLIKGPLTITGCFFDSLFNHGMKTNRKSIDWSGIRVPNGISGLVFSDNTIQGDWGYVHNFFNITRKMKLHNQTCTPFNASGIKIA